MKRFHFIKLWAIAFLACLTFSIFSSCVTKRKYMVMVESGNRAENKIKEQTKEIELLKNDFEEYRITSTNHLISKQQYADSLSRIVFLLNTDISSKDDNIEDQIFSFQLEKNRLTQELSEKDKGIRNLTREVNTLKVQIDDLGKKLDDATSNKRFPFGQVKQLERKLQTRDTEISELKLKLVNVQSDNDSLAARISELTFELQRLTENEKQQQLDSIGEE